MTNNIYCPEPYANQRQYGLIQGMFIRLNDTLKTIEYVSPKYTPTEETYIVLVDEDEAYGCVSMHYGVCHTRNNLTKWNVWSSSLDTYVIARCDAELGWILVQFPDQPVPWTTNWTQKGAFLSAYRYKSLAKAKATAFIFNL